MIHVWQHKKKKKIKVRATPWWEVLEGDEIISDQDLASLKDRPDRQIKIGALTQVGWLLENQFGIWIGVGLDAKEEFKDLGPEKKSNAKKKKKKE